MRQTNSVLESKSISGTPFDSMPPSHKLLHKTSARERVCGFSKEVSRVLVILNRMGDYQRREAIRKTYGKFSQLRSSKLTLNFSNWRKFFLVGKPTKKAEEKMLQEENELFEDVVVANVPEGYYKYPTLKMLIGLKFVACYCPNVKYFVKIDDDVYFEPEKVDAIIKIQEKSDKNSSANFTNRLPGALQRSMYLGEVNRPNVSRSGKWGVNVSEYGKQIYPPHMRGGIVVLSMSAVRQMAVDCPYTCIGIDPEEFPQNNGSGSCLWTFEDVFIGSCFHYTQKNGFRKSVFQLLKWKSFNRYLREERKRKISLNQTKFLYDIKRTEMPRFHRYRIRKKKLQLNLSNWW